MFERQLQVGLTQPEYAVRPVEQFDLSPGLICSYVLGATRERILLVRELTELGLGVVSFAGQMEGARPERPQPLFRRLAIP